MLLEKVQTFIENYNINILQVIFIGFTIFIGVFGSLMNLVEEYLPNSIRQSFRYGKHSHKGVKDALMSRLEIPKGWFKHFYVFAFAWALLALFIMLKGLIMNETAPEYVLKFLDFMAGGAPNRKVQVHSTNALISTVLMTLQCGRRFYETNFVQIFSKKSKINLSHYLVGYIHYFGAIVALLSNAEGFVRGSSPSSFSISKIGLLHYLCIFLFHYCWTQQYKTNMILVNLRKDAKTGKVATESHLLPQGGYFNLISSPHMYFEVAMYVLLWGLMWQSTTWSFVVLWVFSNQLTTALLTHKWYKQNFKNYPKNRKAFIPFIL